MRYVREGGLKGRNEACVRGENECCECGVLEYGDFDRLDEIRHLNFQS